MDCTICSHYEACQSWIRHGNTLYNDFTYDVENCPYFKNKIKHGHWFLLDECANAGVYCSVCHKKVYKEQYANVKIKSKFCPNCGAIMDGEFVKL